MHRSAKKFILKKTIGQSGESKSEGESEGKDKYEDEYEGECDITATAQLQHCYTAETC